MPFPSFPNSKLMIAANQMMILGQHLDRDLVQVLEAVAMEVAAGQEAVIQILVQSLAVNQNQSLTHPRKRKFKLNIQRLMELR